MVWRRQQGWRRRIGSAIRLVEKNRFAGLWAEDAVDGSGIITSILERLLG
jgi:hypothetical protein